MTIKKLYIRSFSGFTLIELMIVVAIIGILAAIAYPSYLNSITKSRKADAKAVLLGFSNAMERYYTENNTYLGAAGTQATPTNTGIPWMYATQSPIDGTTVYYNLTIVSAGATTYNLRATAVGAQAGDGNLEINQTESKGRWDKNADGDTSDPGEDTWD